MSRRRTARPPSGAAAKSSLPENRPVILVSGATSTVAQLAGHPHLGRLTQPRCGNPISDIASSGMPWAADNDALAGVQPDDLLRMWDAIERAERQHLRLVTLPDAVELTPAGPRGSWEGTLWLFRCWLPAARRRGLPVAIVGQDGAAEDTVPWDDVDALFVGGSTRWKEGPEAADLCRAAKRRGKWVHVGRVNTWRRWQLFEPLGVDSFDGTQFSMFPDTYLPTWLERLRHRQIHMFDL